MLREIGLVWALLILPVIVEASPIELNYTLNQTYYLDNEVSINLTIKNLINTPLTNLTIFSNFEGNCTTWNYADSFNMSPKQSIMLEAYKFDVNKWDYGGRCDIITQVFDSNQNLIANSVDSFYTEGVPKNIEFELKSCLDQSCSKPLTVFRKGERAYLNIKTNLPDKTFSAILIYPNNTLEQVNLPTSIIVKSIGSYEVQLNISREGYHSFETSKVFAVIEGDIRVMNEDPGRSVSGESEKTNSGEVNVTIEPSNLTQISNPAVIENTPDTPSNRSEETNHTSEGKGGDVEDSQNNLLVFLAVLIVAVVLYSIFRRIYSHKVS